MNGANVESKTRCADLRTVAELAAAAGARRAGLLRQVDTYFDVEPGRLKLREEHGVGTDADAWSTAELIRYRRADELRARVSVYERTEIADPEATRATLAAEHGVRAVVEKQRELWLLGATRIHLDRVVGVGSFVELETVADGEAGGAERSEHDRVFDVLGLDPDETVAGSYADLVSRPPVRARASGRTRR